MLDHKTQSEVNQYFIFTVD